MHDRRRRQARDSSRPSSRWIGRRVRQVHDSSRPSSPSNRIAWPRAKQSRETSPSRACGTSPWTANEQPHHGIHLRRNLRPCGRRLRPCGRRPRPCGQRLHPYGRRLHPYGRRLHGRHRRHDHHRRDRRPREQPPVGRWRIRAGGSRGGYSVPSASLSWPPPISRSNTCCTFRGGIRIRDEPAKPCCRSLSFQSHRSCRLRSGHPGSAQPRRPRQPSFYVITYASVLPRSTNPDSSPRLATSSRFARPLPRILVAGERLRPPV